MKIAEEALPKPPTGVPTSVRSIMIDVGEHPGTSIGEIAERTGFPQSHVSASVARLRELGALSTEVDPQDRRRTLTRVTPEVRQRARRASVPVDAELAGALNDPDPEELDAVIEALDGLSARLMPNAPRRRQTPRRI
jgi:DNA-binding MarR family transcriptional regulator